ncbi:MAG: DUF418 domain-containing protein [Muribaculaceae bacterium]|nr:DUF418 domain-containing protein [Muribaculaceae bacterium]MDE6753429.1 DUF418 domain-containing protein [Muribaculaceae bacterium]
MKNHPLSKGAPLAATKRHIFLDALRGFALLGVCLANYPEFSLFTFQPDSVVESMPSFRIDNIVKFIQYLLINGKFYTLFSLLFGIGFSIIISHAAERGADGMRIFYRRMLILALIGCSHLMLLWSGDILLLYAVLGMILPLFRKLSDQKIIIVAIFLLILPVVIDFICQHYGIFLAGYPYRKWWEYATLYGITEENFGTWLRDAVSYPDVFKFLKQGAWERMYEFIDGNRYFKVLGLFLIGFVVGRHRIYADLKAYKKLLFRIVSIGFIIGFPLSFLYAWSAIFSHPLGNGMHSLLYAVSVYPLGFGYAALLGLFCIHHPNWKIWSFIAAPGRMALTNYISQSVIGIFLFYGIGFALGASVGLAATELIALCVFTFQIIFSKCWLSFFRFGPLEWVWRMLTYGKWLKLTK